MKTLTINISPVGKVEIEADGFTGSSCAKASEQIEIMLNGETSKKKTYKPEFSMPSVTDSTKLTF